MKRRQRGRLSQSLWTVDEFLDIVPLLRAIWDDASLKITFDQRAKVITENFVSLVVCYTMIIKFLYSNTNLENKTLFV